MFRPANLGSILMAGFLAEVVVLVLMIERFGFGAVLLLTLASTCFGLLSLQRLGHSALAAFTRLSEGGLSGAGSFMDGFLGTVGGLLLVLPGFLTDLVGLVLMAPPARRLLTRCFGLPLEDPGCPSGRRRSGPQTIDLGQGDWNRIDKQPLH